MRKTSTYEGSERLFMYWIAISVEKGQCYTFSLALLQLLKQTLVFLGFGFTQDYAPIIQAFRQLQAQFAGNQNWRLLLHQIIKRRSLLPTNLQHISETFGGYQRGPGTFTLQQRVGSHR